MAKVIIIGAGAAGLAAACELAKAGATVDVLEARERCGGRILTVNSLDGSSPIELGAEFIHGTKNSVWTWVRNARLKARQVSTGQRLCAGARLYPAKGLYDQLQKIFGKIDLDAPDLPFARFLDRQEKIKNKWFARMFVEGFDAADPRLISSHALTKAELSENGGEDKDFRIDGGYGALIDRLQKHAARHGVSFHFGTVAQKVYWRPGGVEVTARAALGRKVFQGDRAVITLPVAVLKDERQLKFVPSLKSKAEALSGLEMGSIVKVIFEFKQHFWTKRLGRKDFGFLYDKTGFFRTWWSTDTGPVVTGWVGGPSARRMRRDEIFEKALHDLSRVFQTPPAAIRHQLLQWQFHDWDADPLAGGAYSYTRAGHLSASQELEQPVANTLFFAGEATEGGQAQGTVHGALSSGNRAALKIIQLSKPFRGRPECRRITRK